ncbi:HD domain-containing protein [Lysinibacillus endophyticus]|uniref:HD domain-containing protein n=1 Tax=Ureibacillus endophyticus TaxID=1978490 RepID=A0A494YW03_9BACL|nr:HD domain-containing protein [Lysinibacillus endophyticus]MCP1143568.1 HD domain-containing protein [Lysinibacillus endophyticus]RKQ14329.1 HD domain-containing protein [Lysinibacillus endophyticus]
MSSYANAKLIEEKVFKDPVHRYIHVRDQVIWDLISTKEFQRLRRIKQLGTSYLVFHGAEHSRFNHSLGVYEIVRRIVDDVFRGRAEWDDNERLVVLCAALLHDLGHGPFSHAFENVFDLDHEMYTREILLGHTEVNEVLRKVSPDFAERVALVIEKNYTNTLAVSLISSQIDADRMDYLQRDAYYTGVSYGHFDMERILRVIRPRQGQIVFKASGMHAIEDYIMSRYQMYLQIYFHPVSRSAEAVLNHVLKRAKKLYEEGYQFKFEPTPFISFFENKVTLKDYLALDENVLMAYFQFWMEEEDSILKDLCRRFVNRDLFAHVDLNPEEEPERFAWLVEQVRSMGLDPEYYIKPDSTSDLPYDFYRPGSKSTKKPIYLEMPSGEIRELSEQSHIVSAMANNIKVDYKVYYPKEIMFI